jgi:hypothetical protein
MKIISTDAIVLQPQTNHHDLFELFKVVAASDTLIEFTVDSQVDPAEFRVVVADQLGQEFMALSMPADEPITISDLVQLFDRLGYDTDINYLT